jgi:large subunit ribosomal protein L23
MYGVRKIVPISRVGPGVNIQSDSELHDADQPESRAYAMERRRVTDAQRAEGTVVIGDERGRCATGRRERRGQTGDRIDLALHIGGQAHPGSAHIGRQVLRPHVDHETAGPIGHQLVGPAVADRHRQFIFKVLPEATKPEIKQAVEYLFKVKVKSVQIVRLKGKTKRFGRVMGKRANVKKAYVGLEEGYDINFGGQ